MTLPDADRFALCDGPYRAPRCEIGGWLNCRVRGRVKVVAISEGPIQWPIVVRPNGGGRGLALIGDLVRAVQQESTQAVQHWWGVKHCTVWTWRKALGVDQNNVGTRQLRSKWWTDGGVGEANKPGREATYANPERAEKIAASKRGKPRPQHVHDALRKANVGRKMSAATRAKMSEAGKARWARERDEATSQADAD